MRQSFPFCSVAEKDVYKRQLSSHEVSQGYKSVTERSAVVRFKVKGEENTYLYAWTTTPWTLPSNVALCVNPDETYAKFDCEGRTVIMGDALIEQVLEMCIRDSHPSRHERFSYGRSAFCFPPCASRGRSPRWRVFRRRVRGGLSCSASRGG